MKVSVITVAYNSAATIVDTLESVKSQSHADIEHIVIDGASTDRTVSLVEKFAPRVSHVTSEPDNGIYDAMNKGLQLASGDVIGFLNSDDIFAHTGVISSIAKTMNDPSVDVCYGDLVYVSRNDASNVVRYWQSCTYRPGLCSRGWAPAHPTFYVRREAFRKYGGFDTSMRLAADFDLSLRLLEVHRLNTVYLPEVLVRMRLGGVTNSNWRNIVAQNLEASRACRKYGLRGGFLFIAGRLLSRIPQFFSRPPLT